MIMPCGTAVAHMFSVLGRWVAMFDHLLGGLGGKEGCETGDKLTIGQSINLQAVPFGLNGFRHGL